MANSSVKWRLAASRPLRRTIGCGQGVVGPGQRHALELLDDLGPLVDLAAPDGHNTVFSGEYAADATG
jgi:hypothetical protein